MAAIILTQEHTAQVDDENLALVNTYSWGLQTTQSGKHYAFTTIKEDSGKKKRLYLHRLLMKTAEGFVVKHLDGDTLNYRRGNLQVVKHSQDTRIAPESKRARSKYRGVRYIPTGKRHWCASITDNGEYRHLGVFDTELEAAQARDDAALDLWGECAVLNIPVGQN